MTAEIGQSPNCDNPLSDDNISFSIYDWCATVGFVVQGIGFFILLLLRRKRNRDI
jgi:hypothetical protein